MAVQATRITGMTFVLVVALMLLAPAARAEGTADYKARVETAKSYMQLVPVGKVIDQMLGELARNPKFHMEPAEIADIKSSIDTPALEKTMLDALVGTFTLDELKMLVQFYGSPTGQSITKKMPVYMSVVMPAIQDQIKQVLVAHFQKSLQNAAPQQSTAPQQGAAPQQSTAPAAKP